MCRALKVLCVAADAAGLAALKRAAVSAEWELTAGATDAATALAQIEVERPQVLVAYGPFEALIGAVAARFPGMRIVSDRATPGATVVATSMEAVRDVVYRQPRPGGPVR
jgi:hypothetical protein